jgi:hypothetical protein
LWKLRADSLVVLLEIARSAYEDTKKRTGGSPPPELQTSMQKLRHVAEAVVKALAA